MGVEGGSGGGPLLGDPLAEEAEEAARLGRLDADLIGRVASAPFGKDMDGIEDGVADDRDPTAARSIPNLASRAIFCFGMFENISRYFSF